MLTSKNLKLKLLNKISSNCNPLTKATDIYIIFHLLQSSVYFFRKIKKIFNIKCIIGIPYSIDEECIEFLKKENIRFFIPNSIEKIEHIVLDEIKNQNQKNKFIILEIGGYCARIANKLKDLYPSFCGIVEDTNQGHWEYEKIKFLKVPVFSIAQSNIKDLENRQIGKAIVFSFEKQIRNLFNLTLSSKRIALLGYGKIGKATAQSLKGRHSVYYVYDIDPIKRVEARLDGFITDNKKNCLICADFILGVSGNTSIRKEDFDFIKNGAILASGSSKQIEFDMLNLRPYSYKSKNKVLYIRYKEKFFFILNEGFPINFLDESVIDYSILDLIFSELFLCLIKLSTNTIIEPGLKMLDLNLQKQLCEEFENLYYNN